MSFGSEPLGGLILGVLGVLLIGLLAWWVSRRPRRVEDLSWRERHRLDRSDR